MLFNWDVITQSCYREDQTIIPNKKALVRIDKESGYAVQDTLAVVSQNYSPVTNQMLTDLVEPLIKENIFEVAKVGDLRKGKIVYLQLKATNRSFFIGAGDKHESYLTVINKNDGKGSILIGHTFLRVVCTNQLRALNNDLNIRLTHTHKCESLFSELQFKFNLAIQNSMNVSQKTQDQLHSLLMTPLSVDAFRSYITKVWNYPDINKFETTEPSTVETLNRLFYAGSGNSGKTFYDGFNAITEYTTRALKSPLNPLLGKQAIIVNRALELASAQT